MDANLESNETFFNMCLSSISSYLPNFMGVESYKIILVIFSTNTPLMLKSI